MEKIKAFFSNKLYLGLTVGGAVMVVAAIVLAILLGGNGAAAGLTGCTVEVKSVGGKALEGVGVYIYADEAKTDMVDYVKTDAEGVAAISAAVPAGSVIVLDKVPAGYVAEESYAITGTETKIVLQIKLQEEMGQLALGDVMFDFTVTDTAGTEHTLSQLLETKKAVVLNLWYVNCQPCKNEFPYLIEAYSNYAEDIEVLAINPEGDSADDIAAFVQEHGLTFPTVKGDAAWKDTIATLAYPTTIIIDRFGTVGLIHTGGIDSAKVFEDAFAYFVADGYVQSTVENILDLAVEVVPSGAGTKENPQEFAGVTEFEITVPAGADYYCNVYRVSGMELTVESNTLKVTFGEIVCESENGLVKLQLPVTTDPSTPATLCFTNTGDAEETYKVTFAYPEGAMENPIPMELGKVSVEVKEGNTQGTYLSYVAKESGNLTLNGLKKNKGYNVTLYNQTSFVQNTLEEDSEEIDGKTVLAIPVEKGNEVQILVSANADSQGNYPAVSVSFTASVEKEEDTTEPTQKVEETKPEETKPEETKPEETKPEETKPAETKPTEPAGPNLDGTLVNPDEPVEEFGFNSFSIDVGAGEKKRVSIVRAVDEATLCIYDKDAYVIYKGKTYTPSNGAIYIYMVSEGSFTPLELEIGNSGSSNKTFDVAFYFAEGTQQNPIKLNEGENKIKCASGNEKGTFYTFKASAAGTLTLDVLGIDPATVVYGISINDMQETTTVVTLEEGSTTVSIELPAGAKAEIVFTTKDPNREWKIPAAEITVNATFQ